MRGGEVAAALLDPRLMTGDAVLSVPSSVVMVAHATLFGIVPGAALSLLGRVSVTVTGIAPGRRGGELSSA
jgi:hypothetical protein